MSYNLAVWEGDRPTTDAEAKAIFDRLYDQLMEPDQSASPTPSIQRYVDELLSRWPDITTDEGDESPWADGPLIGNASGPMIYVSIVMSTPAEVFDEVAQLASARGLVCFDPQAVTLL
jgi:hypothetical protein